MNCCSNTNYGKCSLSDRQTPRHQDKREISLRFEVFAGFSTSESSRFWISVQFFGRNVWKSGVDEKGLFSLDRLQFKAQFLPSNYVAQIELPELTREAKRGPTLIEIYKKLHAESAPEIGQRNVSADRFQPDLSMEREQLSIVDEAVE